MGFEIAVGGRASAHGARAVRHGLALAAGDAVATSPGCTQRIKLAAGILILAIRNPVFMAKEIASLQFLSGGRFELGVGAGWDAHEFQVAGVPLKQRGGRTDEILDIFVRLWTGEPVTHHGKYYSFDDVTIELRSCRSGRICGWRAAPRQKHRCRPIRRRWRRACSNASAAAPTAGSRAPPARTPA